MSYLDILFKDFISEKKVLLVSVKNELPWLTKDKLYYGTKKRFSNGYYYKVVTDDNEEHELLKHRFEEIKLTKLTKFLFE